MRSGVCPAVSWRTPSPHLPSGRQSHLEPLGILADKGLWYWGMGLLGSVSNRYLIDLSPAYVPAHFTKQSSIVGCRPQFASLSGQFPSFVFLQLDVDVVKSAREITQVQTHSITGPPHSIPANVTAVFD